MKKYFVKKTNVVAFSTLLIFSPLIADTKYTAAFLELGVSAKALSVGGAYAAQYGEASGYYWNPAGLGTVQGIELSAMYSSLYGNLTEPLANFNHLGASATLRGGGHFAINWIRFAVDEIPRYPDLKGESYGQRLTDPNLRPSGVALGYFKDTEDAVYFSFALNNQFNLPLGWLYLDLPIQLPVGVNFKWIRQRIFNSRASGLGLDIGAMIRFDMGQLWNTRWMSYFTFGISAIDLTQTVLTWNSDHEETIKRNVMPGISYDQPMPAHAGTLRFFWAHSSRYNTQHYGLEYDVKGIAIRCGLNDKNFSAGAGLKFWKLRIDYAFVTQDLGNSHRIGGAVIL
jgi:hypothetical protein